MMNEPTREEMTELLFRAWMGELKNTPEEYDIIQAIRRIIEEKPLMPRHSFDPMGKHTHSNVITPKEIEEKLDEYRSNAFKEAKRRPPVSETYNVKKWIERENWKQAPGVIVKKGETNSFLAPRNYSIPCNAKHCIIIFKGYLFWWCSAHYQPLMWCEHDKTIFNTSWY